MHSHKIWERYIQRQHIIMLDNDELASSLK